MPVVISENTAKGVCQHVNPIDVREVRDLLGKHVQAGHKRRLDLPVTLERHQQVGQCLQIGGNPAGGISDGGKGMGMMRWLENLAMKRECAFFISTEIAEIGYFLTVQCVGQVEGGIRIVKQYPHRSVQSRWRANHGVSKPDGLHSRIGGNECFELRA